MRRSPYAEKKVESIFVDWLAVWLIFMGVKNTDSLFSLKQLFRKRGKYFSRIS